MLDIVSCNIVPVFQYPYPATDTQAECGGESVGGCVQERVGGNVCLPCTQMQVRMRSTGSRVAPKPCLPAYVCLRAACER